MTNQQYAGCWYCDNILDHPTQVGLLYLGFPRCFVLIPNSTEFYFSTYEQFLQFAKVNWLDPNDIHNYTQEQKEEVLQLLWNFSIDQENEEDIIAEENSTLL